MPADVDTLRDVLHGDDPAAASMAALIAFHGIHAGQLRRPQLTDIRDGRLHVDGRVIPLAQPVCERTVGWLDPAGGPLAAQRKTAPVHPPADRGAHRPGLGARFLALRMRMPAKSMRDDRILDEAQASAGDVRRLVDLFGITVSTVSTAARYARTVDRSSFEQ